MGAKTLTTSAVDMSHLAIVDDVLPDTQNFSVLKDTALQQIKQLAGDTWTNFNDSDPGVTILDQLCYALTELGYCNEFPIADVLTQADGKIHYKNQFFEAQEILSTSPVTLDDYRKLILDQVPEVRAIYLYPEQFSRSDCSLTPMTGAQCAPNAYRTGRYFSYLLLKPGVNNDDSAAINAICTRVGALLNGTRNLGEVFLSPRKLTPHPLSLKAKVYLTQAASAPAVYQQIQLALDQYAAPLAVQSGYTQLQEQGLTANEIFNGPQLQHGWINGLAPKCERVNLFDLSMLIAAIDGVAAVEDIGLILAPERSIREACCRIAEGASIITEGAGEFSYTVRDRIGIQPDQAGIAQSIFNIAMPISKAAGRIYDAARDIGDDIGLLPEKYPALTQAIQTIHAHAARLTADTKALAHIGTAAIDSARLADCFSKIAKGAKLIANAAPVLSTSESQMLISTEHIAEIKLSADFIFLRDGNKLLVDRTANNAQSIASFKATHGTASVDASVDLHPALPVGKYREIEQYYSIQNTFPDNYHVGAHTLPANASPYQVAQIRQFKAYLTVYDQLLANQFSQLAHVGELFSFTSAKGQALPAPHPGQGTRHKLRDPLPQQKFVNTYFCQPLYEIPQIKPILRGHDAFHYQFDPNTSEQLVERRAWDEFKKYPFNEYICGMHHRMESEQDATQRRDRMLSHLMARHGDDASQYDAMLTTCQWYGSELKTRIIVKSMWLQNYQMLSYRRTRAHDSMSARALGMPGRFCISQQNFNDFSQKQGNRLGQDVVYGLIENGFPSIEALRDFITSQWLRAGASQSQCAQWQASLAVSDRNFALPSLRTATTTSQSRQAPWWQQNLLASRDGELDQSKIFAEAQLQASDFASFSTFELKLGILLGLPQYYQQLAAKLLALLEDLGFCNWIECWSTSDATEYHLPGSDISIVRNEGKDQLFDGQQCLMDIHWDTPATHEDYQEHIDQLIWLARERKGFFLVEPVLWLAGMAKERWQEHGLQQQFLSALLVFPSYITLLQQASFMQFLHTLLALHWPAHVEARILDLSFKRLKAAIPAFIHWQNSLHQATPAAVWPSILVKLLITEEGQHAS